MPGSIAPRQPGGPNTTPSASRTERTAARSRAIASHRGRRRAADCRCRCSSRSRSAVDHRPVPQRRCRRDGPRSWARRR